MSQPQISGPIGHVPDVDVTRLKRELATANQRIDDLELDLQKAKNESKRYLQAIAGLRNILEPQFRYFKAIFGEIDSLDLPEMPAPAGAAAAPAGQPDRYEGIKKRCTPKEVQVIEALQTFGPSTQTQVINAAGIAFETAKKCLYSLRDKGVVTKQGEEWTLK